jgi:hypothetical protein
MPVDTVSPFVFISLYYHDDADSVCYLLTESVSIFAATCLYHS